MDRKRKTASKPPVNEISRDLIDKRKQLLENFFDNGRQIAGELVQEIDSSRRKLQQLEADNARLRMQLKSDLAIRELLTKIESLEGERNAILSRTEEFERQARSELERAMAVEEELSSLASLYVACTQLHTSMDPREVLQTIGQLLLQFVGAGAYVIYTVEADELVPCASEGIPFDDLQRERIGSGPVGGCFMTHDVLHHGRNEGGPVAAVAMRVGEQPLGAVAVFGLLEQKPALMHGDFEMLRMLAVQGATALAGALLFTAAGSRIPSPSHLNAR